MSTENALNLSGRKVTREERKAARIADLRHLDHAGLMAIRKKAKATITYLEGTYATARANGLPVTLETHAKNCASHRLTVECVEFILDEAMIHYGDL